MEKKKAMKPGDKLQIVQDCCAIKRNNMKILIQIIACIILGTILGMGFWLCDGGKTRPKVSEGLGGASQAQEMAVKVYQGQWVEDIIKVGDYWSVGYLEVIK